MVTDNQQTNTNTTDLFPDSSVPFAVKKEMGNIAEEVYENLLSRTAIKIIIWVAAILMAFVIGNFWATMKDVYGKVYEVSGKVDRDSLVIENFKEKIKLYEMRIKDLEKQNTLLDALNPCQKGGVRDEH